MAKKAAAKKTTSGGKKSPAVEEYEDELEPEVEAPEEVPEAVPVPPPSEDEEGKEGGPVSEAGSSFITIEGKGTVPIVTEGHMRRLVLGERISVSTAELGALKAANIKFKKG